MFQVSVIVPCRNEKKFISKCLDSIINQDYPKEKLEVLVIDGMSDDGTRDIVKKYIQKYSFIKFLDNPKKIKPCALNLGIKKAKGDVIIIMDAHSVYSKDYISRCVANLEKYKVDNVGGLLKTIPPNNNLIAKAIAVCFNHFFGVGGSIFRTGAQEPQLVDTVFCGCYKKEVFDKVGLFNENLVRSQDMEFNLRLKKAGGKILLVPDIVAYYYPRSTLKSFFLHNFEDGVWAVYPLKFVKIPFKLRHYIPLIFVSSLLGSLFLSLFSLIGKILFILIFGSYFLVSLFFSFEIAIKKGWEYFFIMPVVFFARHFAYGLGSLWGIVRILIS